jgi:hypothetical protein
VSTFIGVDMSEVNKLAADLMATSMLTLPAVEKVTQVAAIKIKKDAQKRIKAQTGKYFPLYPYTIGYDTQTKGVTVSAEIGPDKDMVIGGGPIKTPGNFGNILEYGTARDAPMPHLGPALEAEAPIFERLIAEAGVRLVDKPGPLR